MKIKLNNLIFVVGILVGCGTDSKSNKTEVSAKQEPNKEQTSQELQTLGEAIIYVPCAKPGQTPNYRQEKMISTGECTDYRKHIEITAAKIETSLLTTYLDVEVEYGITVVVAYAINKEPENCDFGNSDLMVNNHMSIKLGKITEPGDTVHFRFCTIRHDGEYSPGLVKTLTMIE